ncbi:hypothetical protein PIB30_040899 [Stylosanthes scabra]|uniref:Uncharacterized protein n=1 Tax=Stylosanthes scabra TaxID=79078 RepID=A0ABU6VDS4_9FABA|nr:hypothetical protein [Stylosanthes scabra]
MVIIEHENKSKECRELLVIKSMEWDVKSFGDVFPLRANVYIRIPILGSQLSSTTNLVNRYDLSYDFEPERTLLRRRREARRARQAELEQQLNMAANNEDDLNTDNNRVTLGQYINPTVESCGSTIRRLAI